MPFSSKGFHTSRTHRGRVGGEIEPRAALAHRLQQPAFAEADLAHLLGAGERREYDVGGTPKVGDRIDPGRAGLDERLRAFLAHVVDDEVVACLAQVGAMPMPMVPRPMNPTAGFVSSFMP